MTDLERLFEPGPTDRQYRVLVYVLGAHSVDVVDVGRMLHEHEGCKWCHSDAISVLSALERRGLVAIHRNHVTATRRAAERSREVRAGVAA